MAGLFYCPMKLPVNPPVAPMLAALELEIPTGPVWQYEMKMDGFRAIVFYDGNELFIQSRDLKPLNRYFPELDEQLRKSLPSSIVVDGEIVIEGPKGLDFDALLLRIHPAASRIRKLANETPASFVAFDLLCERNESLLAVPLQERRLRLEAALKNSEKPVYLAPSTTDRKVATRWFHKYEGAGLDGIIAKRLDGEYVPGERMMVKIKHRRTVDCVVGGFRWYRGDKQPAVGSLLLGLFDGATLHYVGHASNFSKPNRRELLEFLAPYRTDAQASTFGQGRTPGEISRWSQQRSADWEPLRPELVCEVTFDHLQGKRFRHAATFQRWRFDKSPNGCTFDQIKSPKGFRFDKIFS